MNEEQHIKLVDRNTPTTVAQYRLTGQMPGMHDIKHSLLAIGK